MPLKKVNKKIATSVDVARKAGVSQSTVSRVFNHAGINVRDESRKKVIAAADELGYVPNAIAQIMASGHSKIIGIITSNTYNLFYSNVTLLLTNVLQSYGFRVILISATPTEDSQSLLRSLRQYRIDGAIITSSALSHHVTDSWLNQDMPIVLFNGYLQGQRVNAVQSDQYGSGQIMANYLTKIGHKRFAYVSTELSTYSNYDARQNGFLDTLCAQNIDEYTIIPADYSYQSGYESGYKLFTGVNPPDAVFCAGDINGLGVIDAARELGLTIGRDVSITAYDAPIIPSLSAYSLTALSQPVELLVEDAVNLMIELIKTSPETTRLITRPMKLTIRSSSRPLSESE